MVLDAPSFLISGTAEKVRLRFGYLNSNVPLCEEMVVVMRSLMNQIANMGGEESSQQLWNSALQGMNHSQDSCTGVGYQIESAGLSFIKNLLMLLGNSCASTWFVLLYNHWCHLCLAKYELGERVPQMVGTGQIKLGKDDDFTWHIEPLCVI